jgi:hypothetical protein
LKACVTDSNSLIACVQVDALLQELGFSGVQAALRVHDYSEVKYDLLLESLLAFGDGSVSRMSHTGLQRSAPLVPGATSSSYLSGLSAAGKLNAVSTVYHALQPCGIEVVAESATAMAGLSELQQMDFNSSSDRQALLHFLDHYNLSYYISVQLRAAFLSESTTLDDIYVALGHCAREGLREFWHAQDTKTGKALLLLQRAGLIETPSLALNATLGGCKRGCKSQDAEWCWCEPASSYSSSTQTVRSTIFSALLRATSAVSSSVTIINFSGVSSARWLPTSTAQHLVRVRNTLHYNLKLPHCLLIY